MKLTLALLVALVFACDQVVEEPLPQPGATSAVVGGGELSQYPLLLLDYVSAKAQLADCEDERGNYTCLIIDDLLESLKEGVVIIRPPRPRHCPQMTCENAPSRPTTGPICEPDQCKNLFGSACHYGLEDLQLSVKAADPSYVKGRLLSDGVVIATTYGEGGGSVIQGAECNTAILDFGTPLPEIAGPDMDLIIETGVTIGDELVFTKFKVKL